MKYNRLKVLSNRMEKRGSQPRRFAYWLCDCGETGSSPLYKIQTGHTKSCGCLRTELRKLGNNKPITHGMTKTRTYKSWQAMKDRCANINNKDYEHYGGRGITYDESWNRFEVFLTDMGERPEGKSIDRIDVNGNYCKGNCRWADQLTQIHNRRI